MVRFGRRHPPKAIPCQRRLTPAAEKSVFPSGPKTIIVLCHKCCYPAVLIASSSECWEITSLLLAYLADWALPSCVVPPIGCRGPVNQHPDHAPSRQHLAKARIDANIRPQHRDVQKMGSPLHKRTSTRNPCCRGDGFAFYKDLTAISPRGSS